MQRALDLQNLQNYWLFHSNISLFGCVCNFRLGSSRANHRQDQSALTYLLHLSNISISHDRTSSQDGLYTKCDRNIYKHIPFDRVVNRVIYQWMCS